MIDIAARVAATKKTENKFRHKPFNWSKSATCIHLMRFHAAQLGHNLPVVPKFRSPFGAKKALKRMGHDDIPSLLDSLFVPTPILSLRVGDLIVTEGSDQFHAILIKGDKRKCLGWHEDEQGCTIIEVDIAKAVGGWAL